MTDQKNHGNPEVLSAVLQLEEAARNTEDLLSLHYFIVNETRRIVHYRHAVLLKANAHGKPGFQAIRASGTSLLDRSIPKIQWIERLTGNLVNSTPDGQPVTVTPEQLPETLQKDWNSFSLPFPVWVAMRLPDNTLIGSLWLEKETPWSDTELFLVKRLADSYAHAWGYFTRQRRMPSWTLSTEKKWAVAALLAILFLLPVRHSTLGPVRVVAKDPLVVSAPIDGVVASIPVEPGQMITQGTTLFSYEDTNYRNEYSVAEQSLAVAEAELRKATQGAFQDQKSQAEVALLQAKADLATIRKNYAGEMLDHVNVVAEKDGFLLLNDKSELIGRPVKTGERLMEIAEAGKLMLRIDLPVENNIDLSPGAAVKAYLNVDPSHSIDAEVTYIGFRAETAPGDTLVYKIEARLAEKPDALKIGWQGTARIYGDSVSLFFYLFRRPLVAVRQYLGV